LLGFVGAIEGLYLVLDFEFEVQTLGFQIADLADIGKSGLIRGGVGFCRIRELCLDLRERFLLGFEFRFEGRPILRYRHIAAALVDAFGNGLDFGFQTAFLRGDLFLVFIHRLARERGKEGRKIGIPYCYLLVGDSASHAEQHRPLRIDALCREIAGVGDEFEYLFGANSRDLLVPLLDGAGHVVVEAFLLVPDELLDGRSAFLLPFLGEAAAEGYDFAIDQQNGRYLMRELRDDFAVRVVGLDAELLSVLAVLAEEQPDEAVEDRGLAEAVLAVDFGEAVVELDRQISETLEIQKSDFFNDYRFHLR
jgi:hypothetical protein